MEAKKYRVGNYVRTATPNGYMKIPNLDTYVQGITLFGSLMFCHKPDQNGFEMHTNHVRGVPLNDKLLYAMGFDFDKHAMQGNKLGWQHEFNGMGVEFSFIDGVLTMHDDPFETEWEYVHEFQNYFFAVNSKEVELKLDS